MSRARVPAGNAAADIRAKEAANRRPQLCQDPLLVRAMEEIFEKYDRVRTVIAKVGACWPACKAEGQLTRRRERGRVTLKRRKLGHTSGCSIAGASRASSACARPLWTTLEAKGRGARGALASSRPCLALREVTPCVWPLASTSL